MYEGTPLGTARTLVVISRLPYATEGMFNRVEVFKHNFSGRRQGLRNRWLSKSIEESNMENTLKNVSAMTLAGALLAGICLFSSPAKADVAAAEATFKAKCAMCHGADGKGKEAMKTQDLGSADVQKLSDADLSGIITNGKGKMPPYKSMTPDQVKDMVSYIRSLKK